MRYIYSILLIRKTDLNSKRRIKKSLKLIFHQLPVKNSLREIVTQQFTSNRLPSFMESEKTYIGFGLSNNFDMFFAAN